MACALTGCMRHALAAFLMMAGTLGSAEPPREVVRAAVEQASVALERGATAGRDPRAEARRIAADLFDLEEMARRILSRHWIERSPAERAEFVDLLASLLERGWLDRLDARLGEPIAWIGEVVDPPHATVRSRLGAGRRTDTALDYRLHLERGRWRAHDVLVDGVSFVSTYRHAAERALREGSWEDLLERMRPRAAATGGVRRQP